MILRPSHLDDSFQTYWLLACLAPPLSHLCLLLCGLVFFRDWCTHFSKCLSTKIFRSRVDFWGCEIPVWWQPRRQVMFFPGWNYLYSLEKSHGKLFSELERSSSHCRDSFKTDLGMPSKNNVKWQWTRQPLLGILLFPWPCCGSILTVGLMH